MEAKENNYKKVLKSNLTRFLSYFMLIGFIYFLIIFVIKNTFVSVANPLAYVTFALMNGIIIYHLLHFICNSSTLESLKNDDLDENDSYEFLKKMNLFFVICILVSIVIYLGYIYLNKTLLSFYVEKTYQQYSFISNDFAQNIVDNIYNEYNSTRTIKMYSMIIIEISFVMSFISLVPYQKQLLEKYNKYKK